MGKSEVREGAATESQQHACSKFATKVLGRYEATYELRNEQKNMEPADFRLVSSILPVKSVKTHKINLNNMRKKYNIK